MYRGKPTNAVERDLAKIILWLADTGERIARLGFDLLRNLLLISLLYGIAVANKSGVPKSHSHDIYDPLVRNRHGAVN